jgi:flagellar hook protein FlgE
MSHAMEAALSALGAFGIKLGVTANNIANVNTDGFKKSRAILKDTDPSGVTVSISRVNTPGSSIPSEDGSPQMQESSNVDLGEEIINLKTTKYAYIANLKTIKAEDAMLGALFDVMA